MKRENLTLIVGILIPVIFIIIISFVIFLPSLSANPKYNFIYTYITGYPYQTVYRYDFKIENGKIATNQVKLPLTDLSVKDNSKIIEDFPEIYLYNVKEDSVRLISLEEAKKLNLDPGPTSPDGYNIEYQYGHDGIFELFGSNGEPRGHFLMKENARKKLKGLNTDNYYRNFKFIGWIK